jgi:plasmid stabilization system protein ParE
MKLVYLASAKPGLRWFHRYYTSAFPEGKAKADRRFLAVQTLLKTNPHAGHESEIVPGAREFPVPKTPFSYVYQIKGERIEVLLIADNRSDWRSRQPGEK